MTDEQAWVPAWVDRDLYPLLSAVSGFLEESRL
jgi:hypothetical protein